MRTKKQYMKWTKAQLVDSYMDKIQECSRLKISISQNQVHIKSLKNNVADLKEKNTVFAVLSKEHHAAMATANKAIQNLTEKLCDEKLRDRAWLALCRDLVSDERFEEGCNND